MNWDCTGGLNFENTSADASVMAPPIPMKDWKVLLGLTNTAISVSNACFDGAKTNASPSVNRSAVFSAVTVNRADVRMAFDAGVTGSIGVDGALQEISSTTEKRVAIRNMAAKSHVGRSSARAMIHWFF
jgi:hypothetical protein